MPPDRLPVGAGGERGPSSPRPVGVGSDDMPNVLWVRSIRLIFSLWACIFRPEQEHDERPERTHPDRLAISICTTKGDSTEANGKERGGWQRMDYAKQQKQQTQEIQDVIDPP